MKRKIAAAMAASLLVGAVPTVTNAANVQIVSTSVTEQSASGYRVNVTFSADAGVSRVLVPTWTEANGQDDLVWHEASVSGNTATFYVPVSAHKGESGAYITHVYVYDRNGNLAPLKGINVNVPAAAAPAATLSIGDVSVTEVSSLGYRVTAKLNAPAGVSRVLFPTWTNANGQDDLVWHEASVSGDTATFYVPASAHRGESGVYTSHIYLYDKTGKLAPLKGINVNVPAAAAPAATLSIGDVSVTEVSSSGYRVTAKVSAPAGVGRVLMPTWTNANGQDDLVWHEASVSGDTATFYVPASAHKGESGVYTTHIYLYDKAGKLAPLKGVSATVPVATNSGGNSGASGTGVLSMAIPYVTELTANGFRVTIQFNAPAGYKRIATAVWTSANGQDDLVWHNMSVSGNTATCYIPVSDHKNEHGAYVVNSYVFETDTKYVLQGMTVPVP